MRVAIVRRECSLKKAGAERYCVNLMRGLIRLGHDVTIVAERMDEELQSEAAFLQIPTRRPGFGNRHHRFSQASQQVLQPHHFDVVHGLSRVGGLDTYRLTDPLQSHWVSVFYRQRWTRWLQQRNPRHTAIFALERELFGPQGPRRIITQSRLDAELLQQYFHVPSSRLTRVYNGVDLSAFKPMGSQVRSQVREELQIEPDRPVLVFAGMDFRRKGLSSIFAAMAQLREWNPVLLVLGTGDIAGYQRLARQWRIGNQVRFLGRQSHLARFYSAGDLFVLPTIYEPFPNVNLEAMACGMPVVTTHTCGTADLLISGHNGYLISHAWAIDELSAAISDFLCQSPQTREQMKNRCLTTAAQYPLERNARETAAVLEDVWHDKRAA
jgi:UDP-glucose:(heptosyl)LPS alpha-1,3-glucosyltransferase